MAVHDILSVPDYEGYLKDHLHSFQRFAKGEWTQHQFFFDFIDNNPEYPNKVKLSYGKYSADKVVEIVRDPTQIGALGFRNLDIFTYPLPEEAPLFILKSLPTGPLIPQSFTEGSFKEFQQIIYSITEYFKSLMHGGSGLAMPQILTQQKNM